MTASRTASDAAYSDLAPLLAEFCALPPDDPRRRELRDDLMAGYLPIVQHIARRYQGRGEPSADLEQVGAIGLLHALERFDPDRGSDFLSYAVPTVTGEMKRHFRDHTWSMRVPRRLSDLQAPLRAATATLSGTLGRAPRPSELAAHLGVPVAEVIDALNAQNAYSAHSLDALVGGSDIALGDIVGRIDAEMTTVENRETLRRALDELPERERTILVLRFFKDMTQTQIAAEVGVSQMHVSRLLSQTLATLRRRLDVA